MNTIESDTRKSLYIFLCSLLGVMLFVMLQKASLLLLTLFMASQNIPSGTSFAPVDVAVFDSVTYLLALFFGGWYGVWLGLHWYGIVYENGKGGVSQALFGHVKAMAEAARAGQPRRQAARVPSQSASAPAQARWQFEDLAPRKPVTKPQRMDDIEWSTKVDVKSSVTPEKAPPKKRVVKKVTRSAKPKPVKTPTVKKQGTV